MYLWNFSRINQTHEIKYGTLNSCSYIYSTPYFHPRPLPFYCNKVTFIIFVHPHPFLQLLFEQSRRVLCRKTFFRSYFNPYVHKSLSKSDRYIEWPWMNILDVYEHATSALSPIGFNKLRITLNIESRLCYALFLTRISLTRPDRSPTIVIQLVSLRYYYWSPMKIYLLSLSPSLSLVRFDLFPSKENVI